MSQFITAQEVIDIAFTNVNTDIELIKDFMIEVAQEEHIRPVLGNTSLLSDSLYEELVTQNNACTLTTDNETLINDYIKPSLAFYIKFEVLTDMAINTTSKGLMVNNSETSRAADGQERADLANKAKSHGDTLRDKMVRWLDDDAQLTKYPKYENSTIDRTNILGGIIFDDRAAQRTTDRPGRWL